MLSAYRHIMLSMKHLIMIGTIPGHSQADIAASLKILSKVEYERKYSLDC